MSDHFESELPEPLPGEEETLFLARAMTDARMVAMFPDKLQRQAISRGQWNKANEDSEDHPRSIVGVEQPVQMRIPASVKWQF
jgi:hypothetical protein